MAKNRHAETQKELNRIMSMPAEERERWQNDPSLILESALLSHQQKDGINDLDMTDANGGRARLRSPSGTPSPLSKRPTKSPLGQQPWDRMGPSNLLPTFNGQAGTSQGQAPSTSDSVLMEILQNTRATKVEVRQLTAEVKGHGTRIQLLEERQGSLVDTVNSILVDNSKLREVVDTLWNGRVPREAHESTSSSEQMDEEEPRGQAQAEYDRTSFVTLNMIFPSDNRKFAGTEDAYASTVKDTRKWLRKKICAVMRVGKEFIKEVRPLGKPHDHPRLAGIQCQNWMFIMHNTSDAFALWKSRGIINKHLDIILQEDLSPGERDLKKSRQPAYNELKKSTFVQWRGASIFRNDTMELSQPNAKGERWPTKPGVWVEFTDYERLAAQIAANRQAELAAARAEHNIAEAMGAATAAVAAGEAVAAAADRGGSELPASDISDAVAAQLFSMQQQLAAAQALATRNSELEAELKAASEREALSQQRADALASQLAHATLLASQSPSQQLGQNDGGGNTLSPQGGPVHRQAEHASEANQHSDSGGSQGSRAGVLTRSTSRRVSTPGT